MGLLQKIKSLFSKKKTSEHHTVITTPEPVVVDNESVHTQIYLPKPTPKTEKKKTGPKPKKEQKVYPTTGVVKKQTPKVEKPKKKKKLDK